jgi:NAD-dependent deacetylase
LNEREIQEIAEKLRSARSVAVLTGAGISAESGIPTFRDALTGMWSQFNAEELATPEGFKKNPELVWKWYFDRWTRNAQCKPNPGHLALAEIEAKVRDFTLLTQNVDGLHQTAGSKNVVELHGSLREFKCFDRKHPIDMELVKNSPERPPKCPICASPARPGVVWFGELLPRDAVEKASEAIDKANLFFVVGTSGLVQPAASFGRAALSLGATVVVINPDNSANIDGALFLQGPAGEILPKIVAAAWPV